MIVLVSLIVLLSGFLCFHDFSHGAYNTSLPNVPVTITPLGLYRM